MKYLLLILLYIFVGQNLNKLGSEDWRTRHTESKYLSKSYKRYIVYYLGQSSQDIEVRNRSIVLNNIEYGVKYPVSYLNGFMALTSTQVCTEKEALWWSQDYKKEAELHQMALKLKLSTSEVIPWSGQFVFFFGAAAYHDNIKWYINKWRRDYWHQRIFLLLQDNPLFLVHKDFSFPHDEESP